MTPDETHGLHDPLDCGYCQMTDRLNSSLGRILPVAATDLDGDVWVVEALTDRAEEVWFILGDDQVDAPLPPPPIHEHTGPLPADIAARLTAALASLR